MTGGQGARVVDLTDIRQEDCGCRFRVSNGALVRGCRRHDPEIAGRIVKALEDVIVTLWSLQRAVAMCRRAGLETMNAGEGVMVNVADWDAQLRHELRMLLRIRRVGRGR